MQVTWVVATSMHQWLLNLGHLRPQILAALSLKDCICFGSTCREARKAFHGVVRGIRLGTSTQFWLFACSEWSSLKTLAVCNIAPRLLGSLTRSNLPQLGAVRLVHMHLTPSSVLQLNTSWRDLTSLRLTNTNVQMAWLLSVTWPRLQVLWLHHSDSFSEELPTEHVTSRMPQLRELSLVLNQINAADLPKLAQYWPLLQKMNMNHCKGCPLNPQLQASQVGTYSWTELQHLSVNDVELGTESIYISALARNVWPDLKSLSLSANWLTYQQIALLCQGHLHKLEHLDLRWSELTNAACASLQSTKWPLQTLLLDYTNITSAGVRLLATGKWPKMQWFGLARNENCNAYVSELVKAHWPLLEKLDLSGNDINDNDIARISSGQWPQLRLLNLEDNCCKNAPSTILNL